MNTTLSSPSPVMLLRTGSKTSGNIIRMTRFLFLTQIIVIVAIALLLLVKYPLKNTIHVVQGVEIIAQRDVWTRIGKNDTVDSGMHIRIDMTTGEKWVKQITNDDDDDDDDNDDITDNDNNNNDVSSSSSSSSPSSTAVMMITNNDNSNNNQNDDYNNKSITQEDEIELNESGEAFIHQTLPRRIIHNDGYNNNNNNHHDNNDYTSSSSSSSSSTTKLSTKRTPQEEELLPKYDYDMMYRTLKKLPIEEQIRIKLPLEYVSADYTQDQLTTTTTLESFMINTTTTGNDPKQRRMSRQQFETQLRYIWEQRQQELLEFEVADLPQILKDYITDLQTYIQQQQQQSSLPPVLMNHDDQNTTNTTSNIISHAHIISILQELEYQLQDIDLTRDFHTLHGWSTLVSLLLRMDVSNDTMNTMNVTTNTTTTTENISDQQQHEIQMYTAWVIGTALKHIPEFHSYAIEPISIPILQSSSESSSSSESATTTNTTTNTTTTTLDIILQQIQISYKEYSRTRTTMTATMTNDTTFTLENRDNDNALLLNTNKLLQTKLLRYLYCLGSLLRGNYLSQDHLLLSTLPPQQQQSNSATQQGSSSSSSSSQQQQQQLSVDHHDERIATTSTTTRLHEFLHRVLFPSLHQIQHQEFIQSLGMKSNKSSSNDDIYSKQHMDFLYKFTKRMLHIVLDCLDEIHSNIFNVTDDKWNLQSTNPTQYQKIQQIYTFWHRELCHHNNNTPATTTTTTSTTEDMIEARLLYHQNSSNNMNFHTFLQLTTQIVELSLSNHPYNKLNEIQSIITSILGHCPDADLVKETPPQYSDQ